MKNVINTMEELGSRKLGLQRSEVRVTSGRASDKYPMSTRWAFISGRWKPAGNVQAFWKYAAMLVMLFALGVGQMWGTDYVQMTPGTDALADGDEVLIAIQDRKAGKFYFVQCGSTKHLEQTVTTGTVSNPNAATIWIATKSSSNWTFRKKGATSNGYLYNSGSNTTLNTNNSTSATWYVSNGSSGSPAYKYFKIQQGSSSGRYISWSGSTFAAYANSNWGSKGVQGAGANLVQYNGALQIFRKAASGYAVTYNNGGHGTAPDNTTASAVTLSAITGVTGYTCTGWKANVAVTNTSTSASISAGTLIPNGTNVTLSQATTFTAQWETAKYTVSFGVSPAGYGTVSQASVTNVPHGTVPTSSTNTVTVNGTTVTATPHAQDADYTYSFSNWSNVPGSVTSAVTITANFTRTARALTNYRTLCCTELGTPANLNATPSGVGGTVYWDAVDHADGYEVSIDGGSNWSSTNTNSYTITGQTCGGNTVNWMVRATGDGSTYCATGPSASSSFVTSACACTSTYSFHYKNNGNWNAENICFSPVAGATNNYLTDEISLPYAQSYKVGWQGVDQSYTSETGFSGNMPFFHKRDKTFGANPQNGNIGGGKGKFHVYHDSGSTNKYVSFIPTGYTLNFGSGVTWVNDLTLNFTGNTSAWNEAEWYTDITTLTDAQIGKQVFVGLQTTNGYVWCDPYSQKDNLNGLRTKTGADSWLDGGMSTSYAEKTGKFRIYATSGDKNWYVTFVPHFRLTYNANSGTGAPEASDYVSCEGNDAARTIAISATEPTRDGYCFKGWATTPERAAAGTVDYKYGTANDEVVLTGSMTLYAVWKALYTVTYNNNGGSGSMTDSNSPYESGTTVTVLSNTFTAPIGKEFDHWNTAANNSGASYNPSGTFAISANTTLYAQWRFTDYSVTYSAPSNGTYTIKVADGAASSATKTANYGQTITLAATPSSGYNFISWTIRKTSDNSDVTSSVSLSSSSTSPATFTMPNYGVTVTATFAASHIVSYTATSGTIERNSVTISSDVVIAGNSVTLPTVTGVGLACAKFIGWYAGDYNNSSKPAFFAAGASYTPEEDVTLKALYAIVGDNYELVTSPSSLVVGSQVVISTRDWDGDFDAYFPVAMSETQETDYRAVYDYSDGVSIDAATGTIITWTEATPDVAEFTLEEGSTSGTYSFKDASGYIYCASTSSKAYLRTQATKDAKASWTITISSGVATMTSGSSETRNVLMYNYNGGTNPRYSCYTSGSSYDKPSIFQRSVSNYTTSPACTTYSVTLCSPAPSNGTISASPTTVSPNGYTIVSFTPSSGYMLDAVTVTSGTADAPAAPVYSSGPTSAGTVRINNISSDITVCATFKAIPLYTVTFVDVDNSNATQTQTQGSYGANITAPSTSSSTPHDPCDNTWSFVGWCPSNSLSGGTTEPTGFVAPGGTINGALLDDDVTYYSVYTNSSDGTTTFVAGKSGTYYFKAVTDAVTPVTLYATGAMSSNKYPSNQVTKIPFVITYNSGTGKYTIKNSLTDKYVAPTADGVGYTNNIQEQAGSFEWGLIEVTKLYASYGVSAEARTGEWLFTYTNKSSNTRAIFCDGTYFKSLGYKDYEAYALSLEPATSMYYYNSSNCSDLVTMTFHPLSGGDPTWVVGHPKAEYTDVAKGTISTFPTDSYSDWTFIGWTAGQSYNDNREDAGETLNDDNGSATAPTQTIYSTGGNSYNLQNDIDMYPVFTKFADNEPFDQINGGDYYIYYIADEDIPTSQDAYGANNRMYAGSFSANGYSATTSCASASLFTFTKLPNGKWTIYDNNNNAGTVANPKRYLCGIGSTDLGLKANTSGASYNGEWTITVHSGNQFDAVSIDGQSLSAQTTTATSGTFKNYDTSNFSNGNKSMYHRVYLGSCAERIYSSDPTNTPHIDLKGTIKVTSTATKSVKAMTTLTVSASKISTANLTVTSDNSAFKFSLTSNGSYTASVNIPVVSNKVGVTPVYIEYTPAAGSTSDGIEGAIITVSDGAGTPTSVSTVSGDVQGRHLPENFVIAAKLDDKWYALPANCTSSSTWPGILIEVDNASDPTTATLAPDYTKFGLREVASGRYAANGSNVTFTERISTATANNQKTLYNGADTKIQVNAQWSGYHSTNPEKYEWIPSTDDFEDYTLTSADGTNIRPLCMSTSGVFGTYSSGKAYDGKVRLLPATFYEEAPVQILEWKASAVVVMYTGTETSATAQVGSSAAASNPDLSKRKLTHGIYELTTGTAITNKAGTILLLTFGDTKKRFEIPWIINSSSNATSGHEKHDVVILKNGKLTAQSTNYSFRNIYVYGGGKLKIASTKSLSVNNIILRAGGITTSGMGSSPSATYDYVYPQVELGGTLTSTKTNIQYEYITDYEHWYHLCLPFDATLSSITYPQEYYGDNVTANNTGSWMIKRYDGAIRSTGSYDAWKDIEKDSPAKTEVTAGFGYIFWGAPKKVTIGGDTQRQKWGIQRMTMSTTAAAATTAETNNKNISVDSYSEVATSTKPNDQGWNLVGNPFMANLTGLTSESLIAGKLVHTDTEPWDGKWKNNGDGTRYVTIPDNHFDNYVAKTTATASGAGDFMPGRTFFVQIAEGASTLTFATANRASLMPALFAKTEQAVDIETGIVMSDESKHDEVNFWIKDGKTAEYEYNADYPKTPNNSHFNIYGVHNHGDLSWIAISPEIAEGSMAIGYQVPTAGEYRLSLSETYVSDKIEQLLVTDHEMSPEITTNLMVEDYIFQVNQAETNNTRFTVSIKIKSGTNTATDIDDIRGDSDHPIKFLYRDKIYILRGGQIYDTTGKQVREINK